MGNNSTKQKIQKGQKGLSSAGQAFCTDDLMCQNINATKSTPDNIILTCPAAKCLEGVCSCGTECKRDPYTGMCCKDVEKIGSDTFCIENYANISCSNYT